MRGIRERRYDRHRREAVESETVRSVLGGWCCYRCDGERRKITAHKRRLQGKKTLRGKGVLGSSTKRDSGKADEGIMGKECGRARRGEWRCGGKPGMR